MFFEIFAETVGEIPMVHRDQIFNILQARKYKYLSRVCTINEQETDLFFICAGKGNKIS